MFLWNIAVTSLAEVWIEILWSVDPVKLYPVTSLAEVWIEIGSVHHEAWWMESLPLRKCGLKFASVPDLIYSYGRHFPCGSVD